MAAAVVSVSSLAYASRTNSTIPAPATISDNNILIAFGYGVASGGITAPTGFALWAEATYDTSTPGSDDNAGHQVCYWKRAASESGDYTFSHSSASTNWWMANCSGAVTSGTPEDPAPVVTLGNGPGAPDNAVGTGLTTTVDGDLVIASLSSWDDLAAMSPPTDFTENYDNGAATSTMYGCSLVKSPAGAVGDMTFDNTTALGNGWSIIVVSLKAAVAAGGVVGPLVGGRLVNNSMLVGGRLVH